MDPNQANQVMAEFDAADSDKDGKIELDEWMKYTNDPSQWTFHWSNLCVTKRKAFLRNGNFNITKQRYIKIEKKKLVNNSRSG